MDVLEVLGFGAFSLSLALARSLSFSSLPVSLLFLSRSLSISRFSPFVYVTVMFV